MSCCSFSHIAQPERACCSPDGTSNRPESARFTIRESAVVSEPLWSPEIQRNIHGRGFGAVFRCFLSSYWDGGEAGVARGEQRLALVKVSDEVEVTGVDVW